MSRNSRIEGTEMNPATREGLAVSPVWDSWISSWEMEQKVEIGLIRIKTRLRWESAGE